MNPDDKFPEEILDDIREAAVKARDAAYSLAYEIVQMRDTFPSYPALNEILWWRDATMQFTDAVRRIADRAEELADAEDETPEGGEE